MQRIEFQSAYVLHTRPYQETSLILELFTVDYGRISVIAKGARRSKAKTRCLLQPFTPLLVSCMGRGEMLTLTTVDAVSYNNLPSGRCLISGLYLNELLIRLMQRWDPHTDLFHIYGKSLVRLSEEGLEQETLRVFEKALLKAMGYELVLTKEVGTGNSVSADEYYLYDPKQGPILMQRIGVQKTPPMTDILFKGQNLLEIAAENFKDKEVLLDAKRLMRKALAIHLGDKPIESRRLL